MSREPTEKDLKIRAAIDEYHQAQADFLRVDQETKRWAQENPQPSRPKSVESTAEIDEFEKANAEWGKPYHEQRERREHAERKFSEARGNLISLLPRNFNYIYQGKGYSIDSGMNIRITDA